MLNSLLSPDPGNNSRFPNFFPPSKYRTHACFVIIFALDYVLVLVLILALILPPPLQNLTLVWKLTILTALVFGALVAVAGCQLVLGMRIWTSALVGVAVAAQAYIWLRRVSGAGRPRWVFRSHGDCRPDQVVTSAEQIRALEQPPDVVWICVNSAQIR